MHKFDYILPSEILHRLNSKRVEVDLTIVSEDCQGRWPSCYLTLDDEELFNGQIVKEKSISFTTEIPNDSTELKLEYYGKTSRDTNVDQQGQIIANQRMFISKFILNGVDLIKNNMIYHARFIMNLDDHKQKYFKEQGIDTTTHDYHFYENGVWTLQIQLPVLTYIINRTKQVETFERIPYDNILEDIIKKLEI